MGKRIQINQMSPRASDITACVDALRAGGTVVIPTDSVYGIACAASPENSAHERIFQIKNRNRAQTLPLLVDSPEALEQLVAQAPDSARKLARSFWPGALTLVVPAPSQIPAEYIAADGTVALRCPDSTFVREIIRQLGAPLACTSANTHGAPAPAKEEDLEERIIQETDLSFVSGATAVQEASTIVGCTGSKPVILREGALSSEEVFACLKQ